MVESEYEKIRIQKTKKRGGGGNLTKKKKLNRFILVLFFIEKIFHAKYFDHVSSCSGLARSPPPP